MRLLKSLNIEFAAALILGFYIAWLVAVPAPITGERLFGKCRKCITDTWMRCLPKVPEDYDLCESYAMQCVMLESATGVCYKGSPSACLTDRYCQAQWNEACLSE